MCLRHREVVIWKDRARGSIAIGSVIADRRGKWALESPQAHGNFYAFVSYRTIIDDDGEERNCGDDRSSLIYVGSR
jgi:hypothetical protein